MKAILMFKLPEDQEEHQMALDAVSMSCALFEIRQEIFRPARKHGFSDDELNKINNEYPELFEKLETMFTNICERYDVLKYT